MNISDLSEYLTDMKESHKITDQQDTDIVDRYPFVWVQANGLWHCVSDFMGLEITMCGEDTEKFDGKDSFRDIVPPVISLDQCCSVCLEKYTSMMDEESLKDFYGRLHTVRAFLEVYLCGPNKDQILENKAKAEKAAALNNAIDSIKKSLLPTEPAIDSDQSVE